MVDRYYIRRFKSQVLSCDSDILYNLSALQSENQLKNNLARLYNSLIDTVDDDLSHSGIGLDSPSALPRRSSEDSCHSL